LRIADNPAAFRDIVQSLINALPNVKDQQTTLNRVLARVSASGPCRIPRLTAAQQSPERQDVLRNDVNHFNELDRAGRSPALQPTTGQQYVTVCSSFSYVLLPKTPKPLLAQISINSKINKFIKQKMRILSKSVHFKSHTFIV
jgi:hypothetical protein